MNKYLLIEKQVRSLSQSPAGSEFLERFERSVLVLLPSGQANIQSIAGNLGMSPSKLRRKSLLYLGVPPSQYVMFLRLRHAIRLLTLYPSKTIADVAEQSGFCDHAHFTHTFIRYLGQRPYEYSHEMLVSLKKDQEEPT